MRTLPKLLPWLARRAGVSDALAARLWRRATQEAEVITGCTQCSEFSGIAMDRFLNLLEVETNGDAEFEPSKHAWIWRHQQRMARSIGVGAINVTRVWNQMARAFNHRGGNCHFG